MHYMGFVFIKEPTDTALSEAMLPHIETDRGGHWDFYIAGGRWNGYLVSDEVMEDLDEYVDHIEENCSLACNFPHDRRKDADAFWFLVDGQWEECVTFSPDSLGEKQWWPTPNFKERLGEAFRTHPDYYVVVVDCHV
jgi:hypothetical protein